MSDPTTQATQAHTGGIPLPPQIPEGDEVYDRIMGEIEPDLVLTAAERDAKYVGESKAETAVRMERYKKAILAYQEAYKKFLMSQEGQVRGFKRNLMSSVEKRAGGTDREALVDIDAQISNMSA